MIKRTQLSLNNSFHSPEFPTGQNSLKFNKVSKLFLHSYFYFCRRLEKTGEKVKFQRSLIVFKFFLYSGLQHLLPRGIHSSHLLPLQPEGNKSSVISPLHHQDTISRTSPPNFISLFCITKVLIAVLLNSTNLQFSFTPSLVFSISTTTNPLQ